MDKAKLRRTKAGRHKIDMEKVLIEGVKENEEKLTVLNPHHPTPIEKGIMEGKPVKYPKGYFDEGEISKRDFAAEYEELKKDIKRSFEILEGLHEEVDKKKELAKAIHTGDWEKAKRLECELNK